MGLFKAFNNGTISGARHYEAELTPLRSMVPDVDWRTIGTLREAQVQRYYDVMKEGDAKMAAKDANYIPDTGAEDIQTQELNKLNAAKRAANERFREDKDVSAYQHAIKEIELKQNELYSQTGLIGATNYHHAQKQDFLKSFLTANSKMPDYYASYVEYMKDQDYANQLSDLRAGKKDIGDVKYDQTFTDYFDIRQELENMAARMEEDATSGYGLSEDGMWAVNSRAEFRTRERIEKYAKEQLSDTRTQNLLTEDVKARIWHAANTGDVSNLSNAASYAGLSTAQVAEIISSNDPIRIAQLESQLIAGEKKSMTEELVKIKEYKKTDVQGNLIQTPSGGGGGGGGGGDRVKNELLEGQNYDAEAIAYADGKGTTKEALTNVKGSWFDKILDFGRDVYDYTFGKPSDAAKRKQADKKVFTAIDAKTSVNDFKTNLIKSLKVGTASRDERVKAIKNMSKSDVVKLQYNELISNLRHGSVEDKQKLAEFGNFIKNNSELIDAAEGDDISLAEVAKMHDAANKAKYAQTSFRELDGDDQLYWSKAYFGSGETVDAEGNFVAEVAGMHNLKLVDRETGMLVDANTVEDFPSEKERRQRFQVVGRNERKPVKTASGEVIWAVMSRVKDIETGEIHIVAEPLTNMNAVNAGKGVKTITGALYGNVGANKEMKKYTKVLKPEEIKDGVGLAKALHEFIATGKGMETSLHNDNYEVKRVAYYVKGIDNSNVLVEDYIYVNQETGEKFIESTRPEYTKIDQALNRGLTTKDEGYATVYPAGTMVESHVNEVSSSWNNPTAYSKMSPKGYKVVVPDPDQYDNPNAIYGTTGVPAYSSGQTSFSNSSNTGNGKPNENNN